MTRTLCPTIHFAGHSVLWIRFYATIAALAAIGAPVILAANFEDTLSKIEGLTNAPREAIEGLREEILKLSRDVAISPNELGTAAYFILSSGIDDVATSLEVLEFAAKASVAEWKVQAQILILWTIP